MDADHHASPSTIPRAQCFNGIGFTSPSTSHEFTAIPILSTARFNPFSWVQTVAKTIFPLRKSVIGDKQLTQWEQSWNIETDATFYPIRQISWLLPDKGKGSVLPLYVTVSLVNNMTLPSDWRSEDILRKMRSLVASNSSSFLAELPSTLRSVLRERAFVTSLEAKDTRTVLAMLDLGVNPLEKFRFQRFGCSQPMYPLQFAIQEHSHSVAKILVSRFCVAATSNQLDEHLFHILECSAAALRWHCNDRLHAVTAELLYLVISAGGRLKDSCCPKEVRASYYFVKSLFANTGPYVNGWHNTYVLEGCLEGLKNKTNYESFAERIIRFVFVQQAPELPKDNSRFRGASTRLLICAVRAHHQGATETILDTLTRLGYTGSDREWSEVYDQVRKASQTNDWGLANSLLDDEMWSASSDLMKNSKEEKAEHQQLEEMISNLDDAVYEGRVAKIVAIVQTMEAEYGSGYDGLLIVLQSGQTAATSIILQNEPQWKVALEAGEIGDFTVLDSIITVLTTMPFMMSKQGPDMIGRSQLYFRAIAYHAIEKNDQSLLKWLLDSGMDADELVHCTHEDFSESTVSKNVVNDFKLIVGSRSDCSRVWPSILAVVAKNNNLHLIRFLLAAGFGHRDSKALLQAVRYGTMEAVELLLEAAIDSQNHKEHAYGSAALCEAIEWAEMPKFDHLCKVVDLDSIEDASEWNFNGITLSPVGRAIVEGNILILRRLLDLGASPNNCVAYGEIQEDCKSISVLKRVTPVLAAIDMKNVLMVEILIEYGAEIDYKRNLGITRTPLQRAAESGCLEIVRYLIEKKALIETVPVRSGGTALQLASMNGHTGVATFLLEHGADPNYLPAKGDGRTAFEAAAEWARVDTMVLLMKWGTQLDLEFGDPLKSQHERAMQFAEDNGYPASKRYVQDLYQQQLQDLSMDDSWVHDPIQNFL
jgi:ankyrin repeat protein